MAPSHPSSPGSTRPESQISKNQREVIRMRRHSPPGPGFLSVLDHLWFPAGRLRPEREEKKHHALTPDTGRKAMIWISGVRERMDSPFDPGTRGNQDLPVWTRTEGISCGSAPCPASILVSTFDLNKDGRRGSTPRHRTTVEAKMNRIRVCEVVIREGGGATHTLDQSQTGLMFHTTSFTLLLCLLHQQLLFHSRQSLHWFHGYLETRENGSSSCFGSKMADTLPLSGSSMNSRVKLNADVSFILRSRGQGQEV